MAEPKEGKGKCRFGGQQEVPSPGNNFLEHGEGVKVKVEVSAGFPVEVFKALL